LVAACGAGPNSYVVEAALTVNESSVSSVWPATVVRVVPRSAEACDEHVMLYTDQYDSADVAYWLMFPSSLRGANAIEIDHVPPCGPSPPFLGARMDGASPWLDLLVRGTNLRVDSTDSRLRVDLAGGEACDQSSHIDVTCVPVDDGGELVIDFDGAVPEPGWVYDGELDPDWSDHFCAPDWGHVRRDHG
jgi:hypothetical protein